MYIIAAGDNEMLDFEYLFQHVLHCGNLLIDYY